MGKKSGSGSGMNNPDHIFPELRNHFFGLKYLNSLMSIRNPGWKNSDPGWKKFRSGIWDKHPGSATLQNPSVRKRLDFPQGLAHGFFFPES
jgi:hypothetical protein